jgi:hypothetical protein
MGVAIGLMLGGEVRVGQERWLALAEEAVRFQRGFCKEKDSIQTSRYVGICSRSRSHHPSLLPSTSAVVRASSIPIVVVSRPIGVGVVVAAIAARRKQERLGEARQRHRHTSYCSGMSLSSLHLRIVRMKHTAC